MLRKEKAMLTKKKIFETAIESFKVHGYDNVTISQICQTADVAKGTFYVHYQSKEDIIKESYYSDMGNFVLNQYQKLTYNDKNITIKGKISKFLLAEIMFTEYAGYEMTCRAFITNLTECIDQNSHHFQRREFTEELKDLISKGIEQNEFLTKQTAEEIFLYLESFVRGLMASWCFSNGKFDIVIYGEKYFGELLARL